MALKARVAASLKKPVERPAPPAPDAPTRPLPFAEGDVAPPKAPETVAAAKPRKRKSAVPAPAPQNGQRPVRKVKRRINWDKTPYAVIMLGSGRVQKAFATQQEAVAWVEKMGMPQQKQAFVGSFQKVKIEVQTRVVLE